MLIDFHTHAFADAIAAKAIARIEESIFRSDYPHKEKALTDGTVAGLLAAMDRDGVDRSVILPVATKPTQQHTINDWAKETAEKYPDRLSCFGTVYPNAEDAAAELERIKLLGLKGVKLHPDYQGFFADDEKVYPIYEKCAELGLPLVLHAGFDVLTPDCIHCTPQRCARVIEAFPRLKLILAHFGGNELWDDVEKYLVGRNVYFDISYAAWHISQEQAERIIVNHGADKILFGSDCPWQSAGATADFLGRIKLNKEEYDKITYKNAIKILGITG